MKSLEIRFAGNATILLSSLLVFLVFLASPGCSKKDNNPEEQDPKSNAKLTDILSQADIDEVKEMGFTVYTGNTVSASEIGGQYVVAPFKHDASNHLTTLGATDPAGFTLSIMVAQNGGELSVGFSNDGHASYNLSKPFIIGTGNNFTICRHRDVSGIAYAQLISGTKDGNTLKNVKVATIRLNNGNMNIYSDADAVSPRQ